MAFHRLFQTSRSIFFWQFASITNIAVGLCDYRHLWRNGYPHAIWTLQIKSEVVEWKRAEGPQMQLVLINLKTVSTWTVVLGKSDGQVSKRTERLQNENRLFNSAMQVTCHNLLQLASSQMLLHAPSKRPASLNPLFLQSRLEWHSPATLKSLSNKHHPRTIIRLKGFTGQSNKIIILKTELQIKWNISEYLQAIISNSVLLQCMVSVKIRSLLSIQQCAPTVIFNFKSLSNGKMEH